MISRDPGFPGTELGIPHAVLTQPVPGTMAAYQPLQNAVASHSNLNLLQNLQYRAEFSINTPRCSIQCRWLNLEAQARVNHKLLTELGRLHLNGGEGKEGGMTHRGCGGEYWGSLHLSLYISIYLHLCSLTYTPGCPTGYLRAHRNTTQDRIAGRNCIAFHELASDTTRS